MQWENLTTPEFKEAVRETGVCVMALGVLEKHSEHLPVGTDMLIAHKVACLAAEKEPAVVFPPWYFGQIYEARHFPGALTIKPTLLLELLEAVFDEIGRNGFRKIVLFNGHGGNHYFLHFVAQSSLWQEKPYSVYLQREWLTPEGKKAWNAICETTEFGHADECETSMSLAVHPNLVKMDAVPETPGTPRRRLTHIADLFAGIGWYSNYPEHYAGDARSATVEKGKQFLKLWVDTLAAFIAAVKTDKVLPALEAEFFKRTRDVSEG